MADAALHGGRSATDSGHRGARGADTTGHPGGRNALRIGAGQRQVLRAHQGGKLRQVVLRAPVGIQHKPGKAHLSKNACHPLRIRLSRVAADRREPDIGATVGQEHE